VPARPSGKGRFDEGKAFGSGEGKMVSGARKLSRVLLRSYTILNFVISLGRAALGEILMLIWGGGDTSGRNIDVNIGRAA
jgi:hypothetical protein